MLFSFYHHMLCPLAPPTSLLAPPTSHIPSSAPTCRPWSLKNSPAFSMTCSSVSCPKGWDLQSISTSHKVTPKAHTSLAVVNFPWHTRMQERQRISDRADPRSTCPHPGLSFHLLLCSCLPFPLLWPCPSLPAFHLLALSLCPTPTPSIPSFQLLPPNPVPTLGSWIPFPTHRCSFFSQFLDPEVPSTSK